MQAKTRPRSAAAPAANQSISFIAKQVALHDGVNQFAKPAAVGGDIRNNPIHIAAVGGAGFFTGGERQQFLGETSREAVTIGEQ